MSRVPARSESDVLADALAAFRAGDVRVSDVKALSDLSRGGRSTLAAAWPELSESVRRRLARQMGKLGDERIELTFGRALRVALADASPVVRRLAVAALWEDNGDDVRETLSVLADKDDSLDVRLEALRGLSRFASLAAAGDLDVDAAESLRDQLMGFALAANQPASIRLFALEALGSYGGEEVFALIDESFESGNHAMRFSAIVAMGRSMDKSWLPMLLGELEATNAELREVAAQALGLIGDPRAVAELASVGRDPDPKVRVAVIAALGQIGGQAATKALRALDAVAFDQDREAIAASLVEAQDSQFSL